MMPTAAGSSRCAAGIYQVPVLAARCVNWADSPPTCYRGIVAPAMAEQLATNRYWNFRHAEQIDSTSARRSADNLRHRTATPRVVNLAELQQV
jgi:hypothetical protein